jgi:hypothetical protein
MKSIFSEKLLKLKKRAGPNISLREPVHVQRIGRLDLDRALQLEFRRALNSTP